MKEKAKSLAMSASSNSVSVLFGQEGREEVKHMNSTLTTTATKRSTNRDKKNSSKSNLPMVLLFREFDGDVVVEHRKDGNLHRGQNRRRCVSIGCLFGIALRIEIILKTEDT